MPKFVDIQLFPTFSTKFEFEEAANRENENSI
jgi:hypothetical protein